MSAAGVLFVAVVAVAVVLAAAVARLAYLEWVFGGIPCPHVTGEDLGPCTCDDEEVGR